VGKSVWRRALSAPSLARALSHPPGLFFLRKTLMFRIFLAQIADLRHIFVPHPLPSSAVREATRTRARHRPVTACAASSTLNRSGSVPIRPVSSTSLNSGENTSRRSLACSLFSDKPELNRSQAGYSNGAFSTGCLITEGTSSPFYTESEP
jgi:hypothetical protein